MSLENKRIQQAKHAYSYIPQGFGFDGNKERLITDETT